MRLIMKFAVVAFVLLTTVSAQADCYACSVVGSDVACVRKTSGGYTNCSTASTQSSQSCEASGSCGGGAGVGEEYMVRNGECSQERLMLVHAETDQNQSRGEVRLVSVTMPPFRSR